MTARHEDDGASEELEIRLLGPVQARYRGQPLDLGGVQARSILAVLMLHPGQVLPRSSIARNAWRGDPPDTAHGLIADYVSRLRSAMAPAAAYVSFEAVRPGYRARIEPSLIDAHRFTELLRQSVHDHEVHEDELAIAHLQQALEMWQGRVLALEDIEADWLRAQASALQDKRLEAVEQLAELYLATDQPELAVQVLQREAPGHPERDGLVAFSVQALTATGQGASAVGVADKAIDALEEAGLPVGPRLRDARRRAQRPEPAQQSSGPPPRQLPPDTGAFTGREAEVAMLVSLADATCDEAASTVSVCAVNGMAGVGKTALAVHVGHRVADRFPDGQLFIDLHGFTQGLTPRGAADVLADTLRTLGVPPQQIPKDLPARAALYRDRLAGKRLLVVLDNARSEQQVRPLLPGHPGCLVLVTSRLRLKALDDAHVLALDILPEADATALLRTVASPGRIPAGDTHLDQVVAWCDGLPLALRIAGALMRNRPTWSTQHLAKLLEDQRTRLAALDDNDRDLAAIFALSYAALTADQQSLFRRLGLHPGPDMDSHAVAALVQSDPSEADHLLQDLVDRNLLFEYVPGRYRMHDLVRAYARTLCVSTDPGDERDNSLTRLFDFYEHAAHRASPVIGRLPRRAPVGPQPTHAPDFQDGQSAGTWLRAECANLEAAFDYATEQGWDEHAVSLAAGLAAPLISEGPWTRAVAVHQAAALAACRIGDRREHAGALSDLARARFLTGDYPGATDAVTQALQLYRDLGDVPGQAYTLTELGRARFLTGDRSGAVDAHSQAVDLQREQGNPLGHAFALTELGRARYLIADYPGATDTYSQAFEIFQEQGNALGQVHIAGELGRVKFLTGDYSGAAEAHIQALEFHHKVGNRLGEADALASLGRVRHATGDLATATEAVTQALEIFREHGVLIGQAQVLVELGHIKRLTGDHQEAVKILAQALRMARDLGSRSGEVWATNEYAAAIAAAGDPLRALALYRDALEMNRELDMPDNEAASLEGIGDCLIESGDMSDGVEHLRRALTIFKRLGMRPDAERIEARLAGPHVPELPRPAHEHH